MTSFAPIVGEMPRALILGSMPGIESLRAKEYYAHPRNSFWRILGDLKLCDPLTAYALRTASLARNGVALWDVLAACEREGSLDASIVRETERANDIRSLLAQHPTIRAIYFNGAKAEQAFCKHIVSGLPADRRGSYILKRLPSTSPAHAIPYSRKLHAWRIVLQHLEAKA